MSAFNDINDKRGFEAKRRNFKESAEKMGGNKERFEPTSCSHWRKINKVWDILQQGGLNVFMERLSGKDPTITNYFIKN